MINKLIIVEGPDCSGKTTLAKHIAGIMMGTYIHMSGHPALHHVMPEYHSAVLDSVEWTLKNTLMPGIVLDRSWPSEHVYGRELRPQLVDRFPFKQFQDRVLSLGGTYIFCMDDDVELRHKVEHEARAHRPYDRAEFHGIVQGYQALMVTMLARPDSCHYDLTKSGHAMTTFYEEEVLSR